MENETVINDLLSVNEKFFEKVAAILEKELTDEDFQRLGEYMDGGLGDIFLDAINKRLMISHPEIFATREDEECKGCEHTDCATCPYYTEEDAT